MTAIISVIVTVIWGFVAAITHYSHYSWLMVYPPASSLVRKRTDPETNSNVDPAGELNGHG